MVNPLPGKLQKWQQMSLLSNLETISHILWEWPHLEGSWMSFGPNHWNQLVELHLLFQPVVTLASAVPCSFFRLEAAFAGCRGWHGCRQHQGNTSQQARCKSIKLRWILSLSSGVAASASRHAYFFQYDHPVWESMTFFYKRILRGGLGLTKEQCFKLSTCFIMLTRKPFALLPAYRRAPRSATRRHNKFPRNIVWGWESTKLFETRAAISHTEKTPLF